MNALERVLLPLSGLATWLIVLGGGLSCLHVLGKEPCSLQKITMS